ncbi:MipA/OmpV family protein [Maritalea mobilis]|uniref:MipA/OmpV family protein n=1 Tax=Maritalea mobilis TaxID=483324 RepID=UPI001C94F48F|nr:MipA/OmpV family protein [Maritalea mobilis]MBY6202464.1 MipA/OmpV family protein [Maritalea mobilis]
MKLPHLVAVLVCMPFAAQAQSDFELSFSAGLGGQVSPDYFGSEDYSAGVAGGFQFGHLRLGGVEIGDPDPNATSYGWRPRGSFRFIGERTDDDSPELAGLDDVDFSVELGGGIGYTAQNFAAFADIRYGVIGHESFVGELGADAIFRPSQDLTLTVGPRMLWGSEDYTATYFGVTPTEAGASSFSAYDPGAGLVSYGLEVGATYQLSNDWSLDGTLTWDRLAGDAADSPIVHSEDSFGVSLVLLRRFSFGF